MPRSISRWATSQRNMFITMLPPTVLNGPVCESNPSRASMLSPVGAAVVEHDVRQVDQFFSRAVRRACLQAMLAADHGNDGHAALPGGLRHFDDDFAYAAGGDHDHGVVRPKGEVPQNLLGITGRLFQMQTLSEPVGADDGIVKAQRQLHQGMPAHEAPLSWRHFLA